MPKTTHGRTTNKNGRKAPRVRVGKDSNHSPGTLRVRMYRIGFGDFFLVTLPSPDGPQHILIDCGVTTGKTGKGDIGTIKSAVRDMAKETDGRLALIIVTHRHMDHIIGFSRCAEQFTKFTVDAIWMPYWETEYAQKVQDFQADLHGLASDLRAAALAADENQDTREILAIVENATGVSSEGPGGGTNAESLALLKTGLKVKPEYYYKGQIPKLPAALTKAGLGAQILGPPPPEEVAFLNLKDLKKGVGQYLDHATQAASRSAKKLMPFGKEFICGPEGYPPNVFREWAPRRRRRLPDFSKRHSKALEEAVKNAMPQALLLAAKKLDSVLNNQSLVVLFTWKGKNLLFAGDAQAGNWEYWLYDIDKPIKDPSTERLDKRGAEILSSLHFYKVGHHGSTNATPISAVDAMGHDFVSMCSTQADTFGTVSNNSEVPRQPLLNALSRKSTLVRSDQIDATVDGRTISRVKGTPSAPGKPKQGMFKVGSCYIDYFF